MKFKKNRLAIFNSKDSSFFTIITIFLATMIIVSTILQVVLLLTNNHLPLIIIDSILILILLIFILCLLFRCVLSTVTIKNESIIVNNYGLSKKTYSYEQIKNILKAPYNTNKNANELWGEYLYIYGENEELLFKFSYDSIAFDLINNKLNKSKISEENSSQSYEDYYNKIKNKNN